MNAVAKVGWWGGALLLTLWTRQVVFGLLPVAVLFQRRQWQQIHHNFDQKISQKLGVDQHLMTQLADQIHGLQIQVNDLTTNGHSSAAIRQNTVPIIQQIHLIQQRLHQMEVATTPQVQQLNNQMMQLHAQVDMLAQGMIPRQGVGVFIDGANLHASARQMGVDLDYAQLLSRLLPKNTPASAIHFYSGYERNNLQQRRLHRDLEQMGVQLHLKEVTQFANGATKANLDGQIIVDLLINTFAHVILMSGDGDFVPALDHLHRQGVQITVAAFGKNTNQELQQKFPFRDLAKCCPTAGKVIPLPAKQTRKYAHS